MAQQSITVPHIRGYDFGVGVERLSGSPMNQVVEPASSPPRPGQGGIQSFEVSRVYTARDLQEKLSIDIEASYGCASFGAGASARFAYMKESHIHSASLFMTVTATAHLADLSIDESILTKSASAVVDRPDIFEARYGTMFCRACSRGGLFVGVMRVETHNSSDASSIEAELRGSYGLFSADAQAKFNSVTEQYDASVYCKIYAEGGPSLTIKDPSDPAGLLVNANAWMKALHDDPDRYAMPYEWTLSPVAIAEGPLPLNPAQIQHCQDVLQFCARERTNLLDQLSLLEWINDHPERFDWSESASRAIVAAATRATQMDLDMVARCASAAINSPSNAVMPATYAAALVPSAVYPSAAMPQPLPEPLPGPDVEMVAVPKMIGQYQGDIFVDPYFDQLKRDFMLVYVNGVAGGTSRVGIIYEQRPAEGTQVRKGSKFELTLYT